MHNAEVSTGGYTGYIEERTMLAYPYTFPSAFTTSPDCGPLVITINEPSSPPASGQVTFVAGPAPNDGFLRVEAFTGSFNAIGYGYNGDVVDGSGAPIGDYCQATGTDCATVLADADCPYIDASNCMDCTVSECWTVTVESTDVNDGAEGSFPGISFHSTFVADGTYGWSGAPNGSITSQTFEVQIRPNSEAGTLIGGVTWDSTGTTALS